MRNLFNFLSELEGNNRREWFNDHKPEYDRAEFEFRDLISKIQCGMELFDTLDPAATKIYRIYRDVRFSKNKTPYHLHRSVSFKRASKVRRGGYYLRLQKGNSSIAGGFFAPNPKDLLHIRKQLQQDPESLKEILKSANYTNYFNGLEGDKVKTAPKGFDVNDPAIELLRHKRLLVRHHFNDHEVLSPDFAEKVVDGFQKMLPFFDYMSDILTTDLNGISLIDD